MKSQRKMLTSFLIIFLFSGTFLAAQEKISIDNVRRAYLRSTGTIVENEQIKGYFFFYQSDKVDRKTNEYTLQIVDQNLNKVKDIKFTDSKNIELLESSYNGTSLMFMFYDGKERMLDFRLYGLDGSKKQNYSKVLSKKSDAYFEFSQSQQDEEIENKNVFDIKNKGYVTVIPERDGRQYSYEVNFLASDRKRQWTFAPTGDEKWTSAQYLGSNDSIAIFEILKKDRLMSKHAQSTLLGLNLENGKQTFEVSTEGEAYKFFPMNISMLKGRNEFLLMGPYYEGDDRILQDKSLGLGAWVMNNQGKIVAQKYNSWALQIGKFLKTDQKGRVENIGSIYFHNVLQTEDGKIFAIGEGYKRTASALGIASKILTRNSGVSVTKMKITDMVMLQFNERFEVENATIYDKYNNNVEMASGTELTSPHTIAMYLKMVGAFDYTFTQPGKNKASFVTGYTDYEKGKDYKGLSFNSITYAGGNITTDRIKLKSSSSAMMIFPAKSGFVMIAEYFRKDKRMDFRMEKLN